LEDHPDLVAAEHSQFGIGEICGRLSVDADAAVGRNVDAADQIQEG
jgi:hypothetical protein